MIITRSLLVKLILAFWIVSLSGIVIVAVLAGRASQQGFNQFVNDVQYKDLVDQLTSYYTGHHDFTGADYLLQAASRQPENGLAREYLLVDPQGNVLLSLTHEPLPGTPAPGLINLGIPIVDATDQVVAFLIPLRPPNSMPDMAADNLRQINLSLFVGAAFATVLSLLLGWIMARTISRPVRDLNTAARSIAGGDLDKQVLISSRDEIGTLAESFNAMTASLKRARDLRRQMVADIAHELRNPLSIILGHAEALSEGVLPPAPETLYIIYDEARHLSRLVEDLRTLSLSESGELLLQRAAVAPHELLDRAASAYAGRAAENGISLTVDAAPGLPPVLVDLERMQQVLSNLLDNSLKHTPAGGSIRLSATLAGESVELSVRDNGSGISPQDLPLVFERFYRGKQSPERLQDGSGLGLAISKALIELHGGHIAVASEPGADTTISIRLPAAPASTIPIPS